MSRVIMPAFSKAPKEAVVIGRLLAGYGELEYALKQCVAEVVDGSEIALKTLFRCRSEGQRIDVSDALLQPAYAKIGLHNVYADALGALRYCKNLRNQYAHCHWIWYESAGLFFADLQKSAEGSEPVTHTFHHTDEALLLEQEAFFCFTADLLVYLLNEHRIHAGILKANPHQKPARILKPNPYNPPEKHPLPKQT